MVMNKIWSITDICIDEEITKVSSVIQKILFKRGIRSKKEINKFLQGDLSDLYDPFLFNDMDCAVTRINKAINNKEKVIIYGDYDVDGITSTALLYSYFLDNYGFEVDYYLPDRLEEGYGLNMAALESIAPDYDLLITVDCGITACREVDFAREAGLDVIITDHHQPAEEIPRAVAIINPHLTEEKYPCKYLAGVGVAFKICQALDKKWINYLDLVALGTIADIVPLKDENRILVKKGLQDMINTDKCGLKILLKKLGLTGNSLTAGQVGYIVAPPLNAAGRIKDPEKAIKLLTADAEIDAEQIAEELTALNRLRQRQEKDILKEAREMVEKEIDFNTDKCIILACEDWHPGIIGIVASRLVEKYYLPVVLIALADGEGKGSCRSIQGINMFNTLSHCADLLVNFGGHAQAAGLSIREDKIDDFKKRFNNYLSDNYCKRDFIPEIKLDVVLEGKDINRELYNNINKLMPFGAGNPRPKFLLSNSRLKKCYTVGRDKRHLKFELENGVSGIGFDLGYLKNKLSSTQVDLAFNIKLNNWKDKENIQLNLLDINLRCNADTYPVRYTADNISIFDKRGCVDSCSYINRLLDRQRRIGIYINNRKKCREFNSLFTDDNIYIFTGTELLPDVTVDELVLISLPFSLSELIKMLRLFPANNIKLHLLYGQQEYYTARKLIKSQLPTGNFLRELYKKIKYKRYKNLISSYNKKLVNSGLNILADLELIEYENNKIKLLNGPENKLDFSKSIRYNEITDIIDKFNKFSQLAYAKNLFKLMGMVKNNIQEANNGF